jgi:hypothetical protein
LPFDEISIKLVILAILDGAWMVGVRISQIILKVGEAMAISAQISEQILI